MLKIENNFKAYLGMLLLIGLSLIIVIDTLIKAGAMI